MEKYTICSFTGQSVEKYAKRPALAFVGEEFINYQELGEKLLQTISFLKSKGIKKGDKVLLLAENMPNWGVVYLSIVCYGAVVVPVLPDFHTDEVMSILEHSGSNMVFVSEKQHQRLSKFLSKTELPVVIIDELEKATGDGSISEHSISFDELDRNVNEDDLAAIIYTSGTTGSSKGVMLSHKNISWTVAQSATIQEINENDRFLSILPMSHTYENSLGFLLPLMFGASIYYIHGLPTPTVLMAALKKVRPSLLLTVPMIIEKIYRKQVIPTFNKSTITRKLFAFAPSRKVLNRLAGKKLMKVFGGNLKFFGIGGAKLDPVIEKYLQEAKFPYAIGYGLTETSPLLAGSSPGKTIYQSTGPAMQGVTIRINSPDSDTGEGEIIVKSPNVMKGYYKNEEATSAVFTDDGWFRTGDLGYIDKKNNLHIRGRIKNVILGRNGENIYPEEIESLINSIEGIEESLVISKQGKLVAMVNINVKELENRLIQLNEKAIKVTHDTLDELMEEIQNFVNAKVNKFSRLQLVVVQDSPFERTPTNKIKRYLYNA